MSTTEQIFHYGHVAFRADEAFLPDKQALLAVAWSDKSPVYCGCQQKKVRMVVKRHRDHMFLARWPFTGTQHANNCPSYDPLSQSGVVIEHPDGSIEIRAHVNLDRPERSIGRAKSAKTHSEPIVDGMIGLAGVLRELWRIASLDRWYPKMAGKRQWGIIRNLLTTAALPVHIGPHPLADHLVIPAAFRSSNREQHIQIERERLEAVIASTGSAILIAPISGIIQSDYGFRVEFTHLHGIPFFASKSLPASVITSYTPANGRRLGIAVVRASERRHYYQVEELGVMPVSAEWLPCARKADVDLLTMLHGLNCGFIVHSGCHQIEDGRLATLLKMNRSSAAIYAAAPPAQWQVKEIAPIPSPHNDEAP